VVIEGESPITKNDGQWGRLKKVGMGLHGKDSDFGGSTVMWISRGGVRGQSLAFEELKWW